MTSAAPRMVSYFSREAQVSVRLPEGWTGEILGPSKFRVFGPVEGEFDDYRSTMSFQRTDLVGDGEAWFEELVANTDANLAREHHEFGRLGEERFTLSSNARAHATWFEWRDEATGLHFSQLQALIMAESGRITLVNAATLKPLEDSYRPIFDQILRSTRLFTEEIGAPAPSGPGLMPTVVAFFEEEGFEFLRHEDGDALLTTYRGKNGSFGCEAFVREEEQQFLFYSNCPDRVPEDRLPEISELLTRANQALAIGNFDLDLDDGKIRFRTSIDVEGDRLTVALVRQLVAANVSTMDLYLPEIRNLIGDDEG